MLVWSFSLHMSRAHRGKCMQTPCPLLAVMGLSLLLQWPTDMFACLGAVPFEPRRYICECSMHTPHPHGAMVLQYRRIPCVPWVYGRILRVHRRMPQVYGRIPAYPVGCSVLGRGAEPPQFWVLLIWLEPGISHVTWVHYDATMCLACFVCSMLPVLHFLRFGLCVL